MSSIATVTIYAMHLDQGVKFSCADLDIVQNFSPNWQTEQAYGKMDPIANFSHTSRQAIVNMVLVGKNVDEAKSIQTSVDKLIKYQYPKYRSGDGGAVLDAPPFFKLLVLQNKLYSQIKGYFTDIKITPGSQEEVVPLLGEDDLFYERKYTISVTMTVLHSGVVGWMGGAEPGGNEPFVFTAQNEVGEARKSAGKKLVAGFIDALGDGIEGAGSFFKKALKIDKNNTAQVKSKIEKSKVPIQDE